MYLFVFFILISVLLLFIFLFFFFNDTATTGIYTLSLHDALPILTPGARCTTWRLTFCAGCQDRKSTRLNSSHVRISYAVFCLKKKKKNTQSFHHNKKKKKKKAKIK